jgi:hypothetical protein
MKTDLETKQITKMTLEAITRMCRTEHDTYNDLAKSHYSSPEMAKKYYQLADHWWSEYTKARKNLIDFDKELGGE